MKYRHIIWDWNGTIVDDVDLTVEITNIVLLEAGTRTISVAEHRSSFEIPILNYYRAIGLPTTPETMPGIDRAFHQSYHDARHRLAVFPDLAPTFERLTAHHCEHSVLSALPHDLLTEHLEHLNLGTRFKRVIGRTTTHAESKVEAGRKMMADLNLRAAEVLVIGDTIYDHEVASALGMDCALVARGHQNVERLQLATPTYLTHSLSELQVKLGLSASS